MPTPTEKRILQERRAKKTGALLVPIMERLLEDEVIPGSDDDFRFMDMLVRARALPRRKGVYSPSMLGSCIRQAYFAKRGTEKHLARNPQTNGYFLKGNFTHLQWQFAMWQAHQKGMLELVTIPIANEVDILTDMHLQGQLTQKETTVWMDALNFYGDGTRPGVEVRVVEGDWGGTIDVLTCMKKLNYVVDIKGINLIEYMRTIKRGAKQAYRKQIVGYAGIAKSVLDIEIAECLLVSECKAGPVTGSGSPIALHETRVPIGEFTGEVERRLRTLRWFDGRDELPPAECVNTQHMAFQECAFNRFCRDEVLVTQKGRAASAAKKVDTSKLKPARPVREKD